MVDGQLLERLGARDLRFGIPAPRGVGRHPQRHAIQKSVLAAGADVCKAPRGHPEHLLLASSSCPCRTPSRRNRRQIEA